MRNKIACLFGGGGHIKAAGFTSDKKYDVILKEVLENLEIRLLDHLIISENGHFSFLENGILWFKKIKKVEKWKY